MRCGAANGFWRLRCANFPSADSQGRGSIASRGAARINKRMLYSYFGAKSDLYRQVMRRRFALRAAQLDRAPYSTPEDSTVFWFRFGCGDQVWVRLLEWEALDPKASRMIARSHASVLTIARSASSSHFSGAASFPRI
ncbi:MAG: hypothetical protein ACLQAT_15545 [Candidatus Binataceae bacterium]